MEQSNLPVSYTWTNDIYLRYVSLAVRFMCAVTGFTTEVFAINWISCLAAI